MSFDDWKDQSPSLEGVQDHVKYVGSIFEMYFKDLLAKGFTREEAIRIAIALMTPSLGHGT